MGSSQCVGIVNVFNRVDCCGKYLHGSLDQERVGRKSMGLVDFIDVIDEIRGVLEI